MRAASIEAIDLPWLLIKRGGERVDMPDDFAFHEIWDADAASPNSLVDLAHSLKGNLVPPRSERWRDVWSGKGRARTVGLSAYVDATSRYATKLGYEKFTVTDLKSEVLPSSWTVRDRSRLSGTERVHVAEIAQRTFDLQVLVRALAGCNQLVEGDHGDTFPDIPESVGRDWVSSKLEAALSALAPAVLVDPALERTVESGRTAFDIAMLQVYNAASRDTGWKDCQRCGRVFSHQRGSQRADETFHRRDAKYCSRRCAQAAASAHLRARRKAAEPVPTSTERSQNGG